MGSQRAADAAGGGHSDPVLSPLLKVARRAGDAALVRRLVGLEALLVDALGALEGDLAAVTRHAPLAGGDRVAGAAQALLDRPGKRVRPLCVLLAAQLGGRGPDAAVREVALACELVHAATLLHDDVIDDGTTRRGATAARVLHGNAVSVLAGDYLLVQAWARVQGAAPALTESLLAVLGEMVAAEALQLERRGRFEPDRGRYLEVIRGKTASLFAWGLTAGGALGGLGAEAGARLRQLGLHLGTAFQLTDDVLDFCGDPGATGKEPLVDLREGKLTWPLILAAEADAGLAATLGAIAAAPGGEIEPGLAASVQAGLDACGALAATRALAQREAAAAQAALAALPEGPARAALGLVVELAVGRLQ